ncbi:MAG: hypothetical protein ACREM6_00880 [Vulcanimicrobiaceae bacterium]
MLIVIIANALYSYRANGLVLVVWVLVGSSYMWLILSKIPIPRLLIVGLAVLFCSSFLPDGGQLVQFLLRVFGGSSPS